MSDINDAFNKELSIEELNEVNGGTYGEWHILNVVFNGADIWDEKKLDFQSRKKLDEKIKKLTGFTVVKGYFFPEKDNMYKAPDGTMMNHDEFMNYLETNYTMEEILSWQQL